MGNIRNEILQNNDYKYEWAKYENIREIYQNNNKTLNDILELKNKNNILTNQYGGISFQSTKLLFFLHLTNKKLVTRIYLSINMG